MTTDPMPLTLRNRFAPAPARADRDSVLGAPEERWHEYLPDVDGILAAYGTDGDMPSVADAVPNPPYDLPAGITSWSEWMGA